MTTAPRVTADTVRALALALPGTTEEPHHGFPSFRVRGKIFATLPDPDRLRVLAPEPDIHAAVAENPVWCNEMRWGKKLSAVIIELTVADAVVVRELLTDAWRYKAPASLVRAFDERGPGT